MVDKIILNGKEITEEEFEQKKEEVKSKKGVSLVELSKDNYKIRING